MFPLLALDPSVTAGPSVKRRKDDEDDEVVYPKSCKYGRCEYFNSVSEFYRYAALVMYANEFSNPITRFQRHTALGFPTFTARDTLVYDLVMQLPNGSEVWSKVEPAIQQQLDNAYGTEIRPPTSDENTAAFTLAASPERRKTQFLKTPDSTLCPAWGRRRPSSSCRRVARRALRRVTVQESMVRRRAMAVLRNARFSKLNGGTTTYCMLSAGRE